MLSKLYLTCYEDGHSWNPNCNAVALEIWKLIFAQSVPIYSSIHIATYVIKLISKPSEIWKEGIIRSMLRLIIAIIRSCSFLSLNGSGFIVVFCRLRALLGFYTIPTIAFLPGLISSAIAVQLERENRVLMLALYQTNLALETVFNTCVKLGIINSIPYGDVLIFCMAASSLMYLYRKRVGLGRSVQSLIRFIIGQDKYGDNQLNMKTWNVPIIGLLHQRINNLYKYPILGRIVFVLQGFLRGFTTGYAISSAFILLKNIKLLGLNPVKVIGLLFQKKNLPLPMFLGSFVGIYKMVTTFLHWFLGEHSDWHSAIAGGLCGASMIFYRSSTVALYFLLKALESYYKLGMTCGHFPHVKHFDVALYSLATAVVFHFAIVCPHYLRGSYQRFITQVTKDRVDTISANVTKFLDSAYVKL